MITAAPSPVAERTPGTRVKDCATAAGDARHEATMSTSPMTSRWRRSEPAISARSTSGCARTEARSACASGIACTYKRSTLASFMNAMLASSFSVVRGPHPFAFRSRPSCAACSSSASDSIPRSAWSLWIFSRLNPGTRISSRRPSGVLARSRSRTCDSPVSTRSRTTPSVAGPSPGILDSSPDRSRGVRSSAPRAIKRRAASWYARAL